MCLPNWEQTRANPNADASANWVAQRRENHVVAGLQPKAKAANARKELAKREPRRGTVVYVPQQGPLKMDPGSL